MDLSEGTSTEWFLRDWHNNNNNNYYYYYNHLQSSPAAHSKARLLSVRHLHTVSVGTLVSPKPGRTTKTARKDISRTELIGI
jgi:hypothetical protein